jgi:predicted transcriptional regulator
MEWMPVRFGDIGGTRVIVGGQLGVGFSPSGPAQPVGPLQPLYPIVFPPRDQSATQLVEFAVDVSREQVDAIEQDRDGGRIVLQLHVLGHLIHPDLLAASEGFDNSSFWGDLRYDLSAAQWVEVLEQWKYARSFLVQVPFRADLSGATTLKTQREVEKALAALLDGRHRDAVAACRDALEAAYGQEDADLFPELQYQVKNLKQASKEARFWLIRRALWAVTHAAKHNDETTSGMVWGRSDATAAISILGALLQQSM